MCHALGVKASVQERREWRAGVEWREGDQKRGIVRENIALLGMHTIVPSGPRGPSRFAEPRR